MSSSTSSTAGCSSTAAEGGGRASRIAGPWQRCRGRTRMEPMTTVLITGSTSGVGEYVAERLAARGTDVLAHGRDEARLTALAERTGARPYRADLGSLREVRALAERVRADHDRL